MEFAGMQLPCIFKMSYKFNESDKLYINTMNGLPNAK